MGASFVCDIALRSSLLFQKKISIFYWLTLMWMHSCQNCSPPGCRRSKRRHWHWFLFTQRMRTGGGCLSGTRTYQSNGHYCTSENVLTAWVCTCSEPIPQASWQWAHHWNETSLEVLSLKLFSCILLVYPQDVCQQQSSLASHVCGAYMLMTCYSADRNWHVLKLLYLCKDGHCDVGTCARRDIVRGSGANVRSAGS